MHLVEDIEHVGDPLLGGRQHVDVEITDRFFCPSLHLDLDRYMYQWHTWDMENTVIKTPPEIEVPFRDVIDHGLTLVHEIGGRPRNWLHEVSVPGTPDVVEDYLMLAGYSRNRGWTRDASEPGAKRREQFWVWVKAFPLSVSAWRADGLLSERI